VRVEGFFSALISFKKVVKGVLTTYLFVVKLKDKLALIIYRKCWLNGFLMLIEFYIVVIVLLRFNTLEA